MDQLATHAICSIRRCETKQNSISARPSQRGPLYEAEFDVCTASTSLHAIMIRRGVSLGAGDQRAWLPFVGWLERSALGCAYVYACSLLAPAYSHFGIVNAGAGGGGG